MMRCAHALHAIRPRLSKVGVTSVPSARTKLAACTIVTSSCSVYSTSGKMRV